MTRETALSIVATAGLLTGTASAQLVTEDLTTLTPDDLVAALLGIGDLGPSVSNVQFTGANVAGGTFSGGTGIIGFADGIILSTGDVAGVVAQNGLNNFNNTTTNNATPGDPDLAALVDGTTFDAAVLEFDFECADVDTISFQYVFASEEYNQFVDSSFNDVFAFFVNGENIAIVPGTVDTPVSINNVNCGNPFGSGPGSHCDLFINNMCGQGGLGGYPCVPNVETEMDGVTVVMTATAQIEPGTNHIKLAIADVADGSYDSNVFIRGGSLICGNTEDFLWGDLGGGLNGTVFAIEQFTPESDDTSLGPEDVKDLYIGGTFNQAGGVSVNNIAHWDGESWNNVAGGVGGTFPIINDMIVWNDALYVTGKFATAGGNGAANIARWDGQTWSALGSGLNGTGWTLEVYGGELYVGGAFFQAGGQSATGIARWNGQSWSPVGGGVSGGLIRVYAIKRLQGSLYVGGWFQQAGGVNASNIARWDGASWAALNNGVTGGAVRSLEVRPFQGVPSGQSPEIVVGGQFTTAGGVAASGLAYWHPVFEEWTGTDYLHGVGNNPPAVLSMANLQDATLIIGGDFALTSGGPAINLASISEFTLVPFRGGADGVVSEVSNIPFVGDIALAEPVPSCDRVFVGGSFNNLGLSSVSKVGYWNSCLEEDDPDDPEPCIDADGDCCTDHGGLGCQDESCCNQVCDADPSCCGEVWDDHCAFLASGLCEICEPKIDPCADAEGDCCTPHVGPGCEDEECCAAVCAQDSFCCEEQWDEKCALDAVNLCAVCDVDPEPGCPGDLTGTGEVNVDDLLIVLNNWGPCPVALTVPGEPDCPGDVTGDGEVNVDDLLIVLNNWGPCPEN